MGYLKIICEAPSINKTIENLMCLAIGCKLVPDKMWYDYNPEDREFIIMGVTAAQANKLINYIFDKAPDYAQKYIRFRLIGYSEDNFQKPKDSWEALHYMLQSFPKRRRKLQ